MRATPLPARSFEPEPMLRGNLLAAQCPSREVMQHVTSRWGVLVLVVLLSSGRQRFGVLRRRIGGVSERMLAQTLQWLEADGFVLRVQHPVQPPHVDYQLTPLGLELAAHVQELFDWIEAKFPAIQQAREVRADAAAAPGRRPGSRPRQV